MEVTERLRGPVKVLVVTGELDRSNVPELDSMVRAHLKAGHRYLLFDLHDCSYMDSAGLGLILSVLRRVEDREGLLGLIAPSPAIARMFGFMGLEVQKGVAIFADEEEAVAAASSLQ